MRINNERICSLSFLSHKEPAMDAAWARLKTLCAAHGTSEAGFNYAGSEGSGPNALHLFKRTTETEEQVAFLNLVSHSPSGIVFKTKPTMPKECF